MIILPINNSSFFDVEAVYLDFQSPGRPFQDHLPNFLPRVDRGIPDDIGRTAGMGADIEEHDIRIDSFNMDVFVSQPAGTPVLGFPLSKYKNFLSGSPPDGLRKNPISWEFFFLTNFSFYYYIRPIIKRVSPTERDGGALTGEIERLTNGTTGRPVWAYVQDGKIIHITPMELDDSDADSWAIEARGNTLGRS
jgi:hypothetical protein